MVNISSFGASIVRARQIAGILVSTQLLDPSPPAVVKYPNPNSGKIDPQRADNRPGEDRLLLVIGGDQYVDSWRSLQPLQPCAPLGYLMTTIKGPSECDVGDGRPDRGHRLDK